MFVVGDPSSDCVITCLLFGVLKNITQKSHKSINKHSKLYLENKGGWGLITIKHINQTSFDSGTEFGDNLSQKNVQGHNEKRDSESKS
jgi:hypothetical protein